MGTGPISGWGEIVHTFEPVSRSELWRFRFEKILRKLSSRLMRVIVTSCVSGISTSVKNRTHVHHMATVIAVSGIANAASIQALEETCKFPSLSKWTNWVEKKFWMWTIIFRASKRINILYLQLLSWLEDRRVQWSLRSWQLWHLLCFVPAPF